MRASGMRTGGGRKGRPHAGAPVFLVEGTCWACRHPGLARLDRVASTTSPGTAGGEGNLEGHIPPSVHLVGSRLVRVVTAAGNRGFGAQSRHSRSAARGLRDSRENDSRTDPVFLSDQALNCSSDPDGQAGPGWTRSDRLARSPPPGARSSLVAATWVVTPPPSLTAAGGEAGRSDRAGVGELAAFKSLPSSWQAVR